MPHEHEDTIKDLLKQMMRMRIVIHNPNGQAAVPDGKGNGTTKVDFADQFNSKYGTKDQYVTAGQAIFTRLKGLGKEPSKWAKEAAAKGAAAKGAAPKKAAAPSTLTMHGLTCQGCSGLLAYMLGMKQIAYEIIYIGEKVDINGHVLLWLQSTDAKYYLDYWMARCRSADETQILQEALGPWNEYEKIMSAVAKGFHAAQQGKVIH